MLLDSPEPARLGRPANPPRSPLCAALAAAAVAFGAFLLASCGDAQPSDSSPTEEQFVAGICRSGAELIDSLNDATSDLEVLEDQERLIDALAQPLEKFADEFQRNTPPDSLRQWHQQASKTLRDAAAAIRSGEGIEALTNSPFPDPPAEDRVRLQKIAKANKTCRDYDLTFGAA
jgi:hypothetical protein